MYCRILYCHAHVLCFFLRKEKKTQVIVSCYVLRVLSYHIKLQTTHKK